MDPQQLKHRKTRRCRKSPDIVRWTGSASMQPCLSVALNWHVDVSCCLSYCRSSSSIHFLRVILDQHHSNKATPLGKYFLHLDSKTSRPLFNYKSSALSTPNNLLNNLPIPKIYHSPISKIILNSPVKLGQRCTKKQTQMAHERPYFPSFVPP